MQLESFSLKEPMHRGQDASTGVRTAASNVSGYSQKADFRVNRVIHNRSLILAHEHSKLATEILMREVNT